MGRLPCDRDCFNCKFEDCVVNGVFPQEFKASVARDRTHRAMSEAAYAKKRAYQKAYYQSHREQQLAAQREWAKRNREYVNAKRRQRYQAHRMEELQKSREYRQRKKMEKEGMPSA